MKKQTALLLSTLVLMSAVSMQPAHAFKFWHKKEKPAVVAPVKAPEAVKKETPVAKVTPATPAKPAVKPAVNATVKPAACPAKAAVKEAPKACPKAPVKK